MEAVALVDVQRWCVPSEMLFKPPIDSGVPEKL
jgi:hypothetical protein